MALALLDTDVPVYAVYRQSPHHAAAGALVDQALRERGRYCIAPQNLVEFAAVVTRSRFVDPPLPQAEVGRIVSRLYQSRNLAKIYPKRATVMRAIREGVMRRVAGPEWYDLFLAMTMRDAGVSVIVTENVDDFKKFPFITLRRIDRAAP